MIQVFGYQQTDSGLRIEKGPVQTNYFNTGYSFLFVLSKQATVDFNEQSVALSEHEALLLEPNQPATVILNDSQSLLISLTVSEDLLAAAEKNRMLSMASSKLYLTKTHDIRRALNQLLHYLLQTNGEIDFHSVSLAYDLVFQLVRAYGYMDQHRGRDTRVQAIKKYIHQHYKQELTLADLAEVFQMSPSYFSRYFKQQFQQGFIEYVTAYRITQATKQLLYSQEKIAVVASETGFSNLSHFNKRFKEQLGCSPKEYRLQHQTTLLPPKMQQEVAADLQQLAGFAAVFAEEQTDNYLNLTEMTTTKRNQAPWSALLNIGSGEDLQQYDIRKHILLLKEDLDIPYVRFWNLFTKGMNIDPTMTEDYNFEKVDSIIDFLLDNKIQPFIELSYKIRRVHRSPKAAIIYEKEAFKFSLNSMEWFQLMEQFMAHAVNRYGRTAVNQWYFECSFHYQSADEFEEQLAHYCKTYAIIKRAAPNAKVGGPGAKPQRIGAYNYQADLQKLSKRQVPFDFISYMIYPYSEDEKGERFATIIDNPNFLAEKVTEISAALQETIYADLPLYITEWNNTISNRSAINDTVYKGAYIVKNLAAVADKLTGIGYWVGSDLFGEFADSRAILHGGTGLITKRGIAKPALHGMRFLTFLKGSIIQQAEDCLITKAEGNEYRMVCHNCKELQPAFYYLMQEDELTFDGMAGSFTDEEAKSFHFRLSGVEGTRYELKTFHVSHDNGNLLSGWQDLGYRTSLRKQDIDYLIRAAEPKISYEQLQIAGGYLEWHLSLAANEFAYISLTQLNKAGTERNGVI